MISDHVVTLCSTLLNASMTRYDGMRQGQAGEGLLKDLIKIVGQHNNIYLVLDQCKVRVHFGMKNLNYFYTLMFSKIN